MVSITSRPDGGTIESYASEAEWKAGRISSDRLNASEVSKWLGIPVLADDKRRCERDADGFRTECQAKLLNERVTGVGMEQTVPMRVGLALEALGMKLWLEANPGWAGELSAGPDGERLVYANAFGLMACTPDAWVWPEEATENRAPLQLKAYSPMCKSWFKNGCPEHLTAQVMAEMLATGTDRGFWSCLLWSEIVSGTVERDPSTEASILACAKDFATRLRAARKEAGRGE